MIFNLVWKDHEKEILKDKKYNTSLIKMEVNLFLKSFHVARRLYIKVSYMSWILLFDQKKWKSTRSDLSTANWRPTFLHTFSDSTIALCNFVISIIFDKIHTYTKIDTYFQIPWKCQNQRKSLRNKFNDFRFFFFFLMICICQLNFKMN